MSDTPETDKLIRTYHTVIGTDAIGLASKLTLKCMELERERDEARFRFNEIDLCKNGQAPCKWSLKLIAERDTAIAERDEARELLDKALIRGDVALEETAKTQKKLCWSDYQDKRETQRKLDAAIAERDAWKAKFIQQNKDLGCEMMETK